MRVLKEVRKRKAIYENRDFALITRPINSIIVHYTGSAWGTVAEIDRWHKARGWRGIGYHFVITNGVFTLSDDRNDNYSPGLDGLIYPGRPLEKIGAHVRGANSGSIGIVLVAGPSRPVTSKQMNSLVGLCSALTSHFLSIPVGNIKGHRDYPGVTKACPGFDVKSVLGPKIKEYRARQDAEQDAEALIVQYGTPGAYPV